MRRFAPHISRPNANHCREFARRGELSRSGAIVTTRSGGASAASACFRARLLQRVPRSDATAESHLLACCPGCSAFVLQPGVLGAAHRAGCSQFAPRAAARRGGQRRGGADPRRSFGAHRSALFDLRGAPPGSGQLLFFHGSCGHALGYAQSFQVSAAKYGVLIAPQGDVSCGVGSPWSKWSLDTEALDTRIAVAFRALGFAEPLVDVTAIGYSQSASRAEALARRWPARYTRLILIAGPTEMSPKGLRTRSTLTMAGSLDRQDLMQASAMPWPGCTRENWAQPATERERRSAAGRRLRNLQAPPLGTKISASHAAIRVEPNRGRFEQSWRSHARWARPHWGWHHSGFVVHRLSRLSRHWPSLRQVAVRRLRMERSLHRTNP